MIKNDINLLIYEVENISSNVVSGWFGKLMNFLSYLPVINIIPLVKCLSSTLTKSINFIPSFLKYLGLATTGSYASTIFMQNRINAAEITKTLAENPNAIIEPRSIYDKLTINTSQETLIPSIYIFYGFSIALVTLGLSSILYRCNAANDEETYSFDGMKELEKQFSMIMINASRDLDIKNDIEFNKILKDQNESYKNLKSDYPVIDDSNRELILTLYSKENIEFMLDLVSYIEKSYIADDNNTFINIIHKFYIKSNNKINIENTIIYLLYLILCYQALNKLI